MTNYDKAREDYKKGLTTKEIAQKYNVTEATVRKWKQRHNWDSVAKTRKASVSRRAKKEMAMAMIEAGCTLKETSEQLGINRSTLGNWSSELGLYAKQLEYLKEFRDKQRERIFSNKMKRLELNEQIIQIIQDELAEARAKGTVYKSVVEKLLMSEQLEQTILELDRIEKLEKLEIEKTRNEKATDTEGKTLTVIDKLTEVLKNE